MLLPVTLACAPAGPSAAPPLEVEFLGVGGYLLRVGDDVVMTPPLYTNPDFFETSFGTVATDPARVERFGGDVPFEDVDAVLVGHAHYDHLMDLPTIWPRTAEAPIHGNAAMAHLLAAYAPDRDPSCAGDPPAVQIPRDRVVALDALGLVDERMCGGTAAGEWVAVGERVRFRALCSVHPDQIGGVHFGEGTVDADVCVPPERADDWREGETLAFLVDFLADGAPIHRVYYQDAPTDPPIGLVADDVLAGKRVDVALLNVGSSPVLADHPAATLRALAPRYTIGGHWESFFVTQDQPFAPIPGHDVGRYAASAASAMIGPEAPVLVDGRASSARQWVPDPGTPFEFPAE